MIAKGGFLTTIRTIHGWLGILVVPWVLIMGATGFYMNHTRMVLSVVQQAEFAESSFNELQPPAPITKDTARLLAQSHWPDQPILSVVKKKYHGWPSYFVKKTGELFILSIPTGHYYLKTRYSRRTYMPNGTLVHSKTYWGRVFKDLHATGWLGGFVGTLIADFVSIALVLFGVTGSVLWLTPRVRKLNRSLKNKMSVTA